jgi:hypothetical protein
MRQSRLPQPDLFKTTHDLTTPSQRTTAVALLKALLIEAISAQTSADAELSTDEGNGGVEIEERVCK